MIILCSFQNEAGSEVILNNAERYGSYFVSALMNENVNVSSEIRQSMTIKKTNIGK